MCVCDLWINWGRAKEAGRNIKLQMPNRCLNEDVKETNRCKSLKFLGSDYQLFMILKECACVFEIALLETFGFREWM